jgi:hypothetical protein
MRSVGPVIRRHTCMRRQTSAPEFLHAELSEQQVTTRRRMTHKRICHGSEDGLCYSSLELIQLVRQENKTYLCYAKNQQQLMMRHMWTRRFKAEIPLLKLFSWCKERLHNTEWNLYPVTNILQCFKAFTTGILPSWNISVLCCAIEYVQLTYNKRLCYEFVSYRTISVYMQLWLLFTLPFIANTHYMFWPNWPSSGVTVILTRRLLMPRVSFRLLPCCNHTRVQFTCNTVHYSVKCCPSYGLV